MNNTTRLPGRRSLAAANAFNPVALAWRWFTVVAVAVTSMTVTGSLRAADQADANRDAFLRAIAEVETGNNPRKVGKLGERGLYQFRLGTWRRYTKRAFCDAHNRSISHQIASAHFADVQSELISKGIPATYFNIAAAWNAGLGRVTSGRIPACTRDYAQRVTNLTGAFGGAQPMQGLTNGMMLADAR